MLTDFDTIIAAMHARIAHLESQGIELADMKTDPGIRYLNRVIHRYFAAEHCAEGFGYIGVGSISFAQHRVREFQRRALHLPKGALDMPCSANKPIRIRLT